MEINQRKSILKNALYQSSPAPQNFSRIYNLLRTFQGSIISAEICICLFSLLKHNKLTDLQALEIQWCQTAMLVQVTNSRFYQSTKNPWKIFFSMLPYVLSLLTKQKLLRSMIFKSLKDIRLKWLKSCCPREIHKTWNFW